ncbi:MAG TPA: hypothetical protein VJ728_10740, partial [Candidatus Binataceae bacterium]|nr:hypothetical protein [Candidatus Binataceae bacterium]
IADQVKEIIDHAGHVTVLIIHGWNIIEPRIDLGLGLREVGGTLRPPAGAHVSASDEFIRGPLSLLTTRLREAQINPSFGLRYPGGALHNLLQGFTPRHAASQTESLRRLAAMSSTGVIDALQLEMSVAVRLPGELREHAISAISDTFTYNGTGLEGGPIPDAPAVPILRHVSPTSRRKPAASNAPPSRVGIEFFDPVAGIGGMVSFDFGPGAAGGRIMILFGRSHVALFTAEDKARRNADQLSIGPLTLNAAPGGNLRFRGPMVIVDDGTAYLSVERALASSRLDTMAEVEATVEFDGPAASFSDLLVELDELFDVARASPSRQKVLSAMTPPHAAFGRICGAVRLNGSRRNFDASFRLGASFTGLGPQKFITRTMIWSSFSVRKGREVFEARALELDHEPQHRIARMFRDGRWRSCTLRDIRIELASSLREPERVTASAIAPDDEELTIEGQPATFVMLSRPGPDGTRLHTMMGFASFRSGDVRGAGMYEFSRRVGLSQAAKNPDVPAE